jgi:valyl-tRNA synthetase
MKKEIQELVEFATTDKSSKNKVLNFGKLDIGEIQLLKLKTNLDFTGYSRIIDKSGINHAIKQHGNEIKEKARGQVAINKNDFVLIPDIVKSENVIYAGKSKIGMDCILYEAYFEDIIFYVEEVRTGRKQLCLQTMYKRKKPTR